MKVTPVEISWHSGLSVYSSESFLNSVSDEYGWIGGVDAFGKLCCVLPYNIIRKAIFCLVRFPVETIAWDRELEVEDERAFLNGVVEYFGRKRTDLIIPATFNTIFRTYPDRSIAVPYGSYVIDLSLPEETLWKNLHTKHRNVIRNAINKGVTIRTGTDKLDIVYGLIRDSFKRSAKGFAEAMRMKFRMSFDTFSQQVLSLGENVKVFTAELDGSVQGCAVIHFSGHSAYYMHGGSIAAPMTGAQNLLHWEAIRRFRELGVRKYNFVGARIDPAPGSKQEGIKRFKQRFGGEFIKGYMWKVPFRPMKHLLYSFATRVRSGGDIVDQERQWLREGVKTDAANG
jgi:lipid II:glycine glycyltransferase (peptidoglycan interpeptide bridge formation enzyme)